MFDQVADRCDLTNVLLSLGATRLPFADRTFDALTISFACGTCTITRVAWPRSCE